MIWRQESVWNCKHSYGYTSIDGILLSLDIKINKKNYLKMKLIKLPIFFSFIVYQVSKLQKK